MDYVIDGEQVTQPVVHEEKTPELVNKDIPNTFKEQIRLDIIQPDYVHEISSFINGRNDWRRVGVMFETASKVCLGIGSVLSFASGVYVNTTLSFAAGSVSTISLVFMQFSTYSFKESKRATEHLNIMLKNLELDVLPELPKNT
jgi:hypothetical protein